MAMENFIIDEMKNQAQDNQVLSASALGNLGTNCCPTGNEVSGIENNNTDNGNNQVLGASVLGGLGPNCCPNGDQVLGATAGRTIEVPEVLGINEGSTMIELCIPIIPPGFTILFNSIERRIVFDALVASNGKVFINGRLIKKIPFETCDRSVTPLSGNISRITLSNVRAITVEAPFALCVKVKGAVKGARVVVLNTSVDSVELPNLRCPQLSCIRSVVEKDCISVRVKVERDTMINVPTTS
ncbi:MAG: hypothetical protein QME45_08570 [Clostridiales bacterium]|nr:hypothetical protein [Clostridiales bacterium]